MIELALIYESTEQLGEAAKLLESYRKQLGAGEGARILGQHLLREGQYEPAHELLHPYVKGRLTQLHAIERDLRTASGNGRARRLYCRTVLPGERRTGEIEFRVRRAVNAPSDHVI